MRAPRPRNRPARSIRLPVAAGQPRRHPCRRPRGGLWSARPGLTRCGRPPAWVDSCPQGVRASAPRPDSLILCRECSYAALLAQDHEVRPSSRVRRRASTPETVRVGGGSVPPAGPAARCPQLVSWRWLAWRWLAWRWLAWRWLAWRWLAWRWVVRGGGWWPGGLAAWRWPGHPRHRLRTVGTYFPLIYQRTFVHILYFNFTRRSDHFYPTDNGTIGGGQ